VVPSSDLHKQVENRMRACSQEIHLKPHNFDLETLDYGECYKIAKEANDHTIYLMEPPLQTVFDFSQERLTREARSKFRPAPQ